MKTTVRQAPRPSGDSPKQSSGGSGGGCGLGCLKDIAIICILFVFFKGCISEGGFRGGFVAVTRSVESIFHEATDGRYSSEPVIVVEEPRPKVTPDQQREIDAFIEQELEKLDQKLNAALEDEDSKHVFEERKWNPETQQYE